MVAPESTDDSLPFVCSVSSKPEIYRLGIRAGEVVNACCRQRTHPVQEVPEKRFYGATGLVTFSEPQSSEPPNG